MHSEHAASARPVDAAGARARLAWWRARLGGEWAGLELPLDRPRAAARPPQAAVARASLPRGQGAPHTLAELARAVDATLETAWLAAWRLTLGVMSGQEDVVIGVAAPWAGADGGVAGLVPLRCAVDERAPVSALVGALRAALAEARADVAAALGLDHLASLREPGHPPAIACAFELVEGDAAAGSPGAPAPVAASLVGIVDVALRVVATPRELVLELHYDAALLDASTAERLVGGCAHLAAEMGAHRAARICELTLVPADQRAELIERLGAGEPAGPAGADATVTALFAAVVRRYPERRAVESQGHSLTYAALDRRVTALARRLARLGVAPGEPVALLLEPSLETVIAMLGVLRAGACYLPIDPELPRDRVQYVIDDSGARLLIGGARARAAALALRGQLVDLADGGVDVIDDDGDGGGDGSRGDTSAVPVRPSDAAYVIYTSGTTGQPKGVVIEHGSLASYALWLASRYGVAEDAVAALLTSYAFDLGYTTLWTTILAGGCLHLPPRSTCEDPGAVARYLRDHGITFLKVTPSLLSALLTSREIDRAHGASLRLIVTGGERIRAHDVAALYARLPGVLVVNHYGPTETTIGVTTHPVDRDRVDELARRPVIGRPIGHARAYVTTRSLQLVPRGAPGELIIAGRCVGRGYLGRDELTRERFIPDPFRPGDRAYRTGDLVRWTPAGALEFLGRIDRQVKIRGYRVELAEIEHVMIQRLGVVDAVVIERRAGDAGAALCAYYVGGPPRQGAELRAALSAVLPDYMVPASFVEVPALPRTENGKLDVRRLPEPSAPPAASSADAPATETERALARMWAEALGIDAAALGVGQNFFELGGHSLLMIQLIAQIDSYFGRTVPIPAFYQEGTIRALAQILDADAAPPAHPLHP